MSKARIRLFPWKLIRSLQFNKKNFLISVKVEGSDSDEVVRYEFEHPVICKVLFWILMSLSLVCEFVCSRLPRSLLSCLMTRPFGPPQWNITRSTVARQRQYVTISSRGSHSVNQLLNMLLIQSLLSLQVTNGASKKRVAPFKKASAVAVAVSTVRPRLNPYYNSSAVS
jgi:hypothetical protein